MTLDKAGGDNVHGHGLAAIKKVVGEAHTVITHRYMFLKYVERARCAVAALPAELCELGPVHLSLLCGHGSRC